jgi:hypothetical protein
MIIMSSSLATSEMLADSFAAPANIQELACRDDEEDAPN